MSPKEYVFVLHSARCSQVFGVFTTERKAMAAKEQISRNGQVLEITPVKLNRTTYN